jgi:branched-chain amino acid transport system permease protein
LGVRITSQSEFVVLIYALVAFCGLVAWRVVHSPFGRVLRGIRDDEVAAAACGKNVSAYKVAVFAISGALAAVAGTLYATYVTFIDPQSFLLGESFFILIIVVIGGAGTFWGPIAGAVVLWLMPEALRFLHLPDAVVGPLRQVLYGALLIGFILFRPAGLVSRRAT